MGKLQGTWKKLVFATTAAVPGTSLQGGSNYPTNPSPLPYSITSPTHGHSKEA